MPNYGYTDRTSLRARLPANGAGAAREPDAKQSRGREREVTRLAALYARGYGPVSVRTGRRRVLYRWSDVEQWIKESRYSRTHEIAPCSDDPSGGREVGDQSSPDRTAPIVNQAEMGQGRLS